MEECLKEGWKNVWKKERVLEKKRGRCVLCSPDGVHPLVL